MDKITASDVTEFLREYEILFAYRDGTKFSIKFFDQDTIYYTIFVRSLGKEECFYSVNDAVDYFNSLLS